MVVGADEVSSIKAAAISLVEHLADVQIQSSHLHLVPSFPPFSILVSTPWREDPPVQGLPPTVLDLYILVAAAKISR